ncbi:hypothetical protein JB92DRAFT_910888 [Gautieria morchelliformis]|nr:hypothetical protein JB92DRAFT_910888 [Gautieria morchelliformis]
MGCIFVPHRVRPFDHPRSRGRACLDSPTLTEQVTVYMDSLLRTFHTHCGGHSGFFWWLGISILLLNLSVEVILLIRVYAVYNRNKHILYGVVGFRVLTTAATVILWVFYLPTGLGLPPIDGITGCLSPTTSKLFGYSFVPTMLNEILLCLFMLYKAWITYKNDYGSLLLQVLIQDSILYFSSIFVVLFTNCMVIFFAPRILVQIGFGWEYAVPCTMGSRLLLSMLQQASREHKSALPSDPVGYPFSDVRMQDLSTRHVERPIKIAPATSW